MSFLENLFPNDLSAAKALRPEGVDFYDCGIEKLSFSVTLCWETS
ncbi:hypothetical protein [Sulfitobacter sp.]